MQIEVLEPHGFCGGVERALAKVRELHDVWCLHAIVHSEIVVAEMKARGFRFVERIEEVPDGETVVFSAHGVSPSVRKHAAEHNLKVIDLTCPFVAKAHAQARAFAERDLPVVVIGDRDHAEVVGIRGEVEALGGRCITISPAEKIGRETLGIGENATVGVVAQTSLDADEIARVVSELRLVSKVETDADACTATKSRQDAVRSFKGDALLVLGSHTSANTRRLGEVARCPACHASCFEEIREAHRRFKGVSKLGITAGASTPESLVSEAVRYFSADPGELRSRILTVTSANGGHLASSLGAVELAVALYRVFDPFKDRIVWDVGHQAYAWKILTGRDDSFDSLRRMDGIAPFPTPEESKADPAVCGHAGVALSVAEGLAAARDRRGTNEHIVAVIGDGAFANGTCLEALTNIAANGSKVIIILNDNESTAMPVPRFIDDDRFFAALSLDVIGPVDGHDTDAIEDAIADARNRPQSVVVRVRTKKGMGYPPAEKDPNRYHVVTADATEGITWTSAFSSAIVAAARRDSQIVALTAGMTDGVGLRQFASEFPDRFHDVGIAEGHLVAYAAGLAAGGLRPVVAVYSTFLQRAIDQVLHDVCIASLPVVFCVDRAGVVGQDGATHQGLYDIAMLRALPNLTICQPRDADDLRTMLESALTRNGPTVIRYPRGQIQATPQDWRAAGQPRLAIWATCDYLPKAYAIAREIPAEVVPVRMIKPIDGELLADQRKRGLKIVSLENASVVGGIGEAISADFRLGWPDEVIPHGAVADLERAYGLDVPTLIEHIRQI